MRNIERGWPKTRTWFRPANSDATFAGRRPTPKTRSGNDFALIVSSASAYDDNTPSVRSFSTSIAPRSRQGIHVLRFLDTDVLSQMDGVLEAIRLAFTEQMPPGKSRAVPLPALPRSAGEGSS
jgi:hypothetical protein